MLPTLRLTPLISALCGLLLVAILEFALGIPLGNFFCFGDDENFNFQACCGGAGAESKKDCWSPPYSYDACCSTAPASWSAKGASAEAKLDVPIGFSNTTSLIKQDDYQFGVSACSKEANAVMLQQFSGSLPASRSSNDAIRKRLFPRLLDGAGCTSASGALFEVVMQWGGPGKQETTFGFCAPVSCAAEEVAADMAPHYFAQRLRSLQRPTIIQFAKVRAQIPSYTGNYMRLGMMGKSSPPVSTEDLVRYRRMFMVCGTCNLKRYGGKFDGGYLMCALEDFAVPIIGAYSYGIAGNDAWGEAVSGITGSVVHQYDCFDLSRPVCKSTSCNFVFHEECLTGGQSLSAKSNILPVHLETNGHTAVAEASLLLKVDIEGSEWGVFSTVKPKDLLKFQQILIEFHSPYVSVFVDAERMRERMEAIQNLLRAFVVVHVHPNNVCDVWTPRSLSGSKGNCLEVTLVHHALVQTTGCHWPRRHPLDSPVKTGPTDVDVSDVFKSMAALDDLEQLHMVAD